jgi:hypothetical protein
MADNVRTPGGWRLERPTGSPLTRTEDEQVLLPLSIVKGDEEVARASVVLTRAEAEFLHAQLCRALDGQPTPAGAPECRYTLQGDPRRRQPGR